MTQNEDQFTWSPRNLESKIQIPTAITLHKLVPKPTPASFVSQSPSVYVFKHWSQEEFERAQANARRVLMQARLSKASKEHLSSEVNAFDNATVTKDNERDKASEQLSPKKAKKPDKGASIAFNDKAVKGSRPESKDQSQVKRPSLPVHRGMGESTLRTRQITRLAVQITTTLKELEDLVTQPVSKDFVTPHETEIKKKRWEDFFHSAGRTLFSLKREILQLERSCSHGEKNSSKTLRLLATSTRSLHKLLLALKSHAETALSSEPGRRLYSELLNASKRLFEIYAVIGIKIPKIKFQVPKATYEKSPEETSTDSEIATSDIDSELITVLNPNFVRERIADLADQTFDKKRRKKESERRSTETKSKEQEIIINLLDVQEHKTPRISPSRKFGQLKYGHTKKVVIAPGPKTTHKRRPQHFGKFERERTQKQGTERNDENKQEHASHVRRNAHWKGAHYKTQPENRPEVEKKSENEIADVERTKAASELSPKPHLPGGKLVTEKHLVERTADAVVNRLLPIIGQENKDDAHVTYTAIVNQDPALQEKAMQIQFLLDRVCSIEDEWEKAQDMTSEITRKIEKTNKDTNTDLQTAIDKARKLLDSVRPTHQLAHIKGSIGPKPKGRTVVNYQADNRQDPFLIPVTERTGDMKMASVDMNESSSRLNEANVSMENLNINEDPMLPSENIADQIKKQKEEFWESLIKRGFMKPQDVTVEGEQAAREVVEMILQNKAQISHTGTEDVRPTIKATQKEIELRCQEESKRPPKARASVTNAKRNETLSKVCQEAQVGSSLVYSYSSSFQSSSTQDSQSSKKSLSSSSSHETSRHSGSDGQGDQLPQLTDKSDNNLSTSQHSSDQSSRSASFPSYDGISNGE